MAQDSPPRRSSRSPPQIPASQGALNKESVPSDNFYAKSSGSNKSIPPPLPQRDPRRAGSSHTKFTTTPISDSQYREPELVANDSVEDVMSTSDDDFDPSPSGWAERDEWQRVNAQHSTDKWNVSTFEEDSTLPTWDTPPYQLIAPPPVPIDGRNYTEEEDWWKQSSFTGRPGPGLLPPTVIDRVNPGGLKLYHVTPRTPETLLNSSPGVPSPVAPLSFAQAVRSASPKLDRAQPSRQASLNGPVPDKSVATPASMPPVFPSFTPPSESELRGAVPHPNIYYSPPEGGWRLLIWSTSSIIPFARSFLATHPSLPSDNRRRTTISCVGDNTHTFGPSNLTHHFHFYPRAVDSHKLSTPYYRPIWERKCHDEGSSSDARKSDEGELLDLYMCCQCQQHLIVSAKTFPEVIPREVHKTFTTQRFRNPSENRNPYANVFVAWSIILQYVALISNFL